MTTRHSGYIVVLNRDIREDDAEHTINALKQIKGVIMVTPVTDESVPVAIAQERAKQYFLSKLYDFAREIGK